jgi:hypothetical protein
MLVLVVTKKVREWLRISLTAAFRAGLDMVQGLKPRPFFGRNYGTTEVMP